MIRPTVCTTVCWIAGTQGGYPGPARGVGMPINGMAHMVHSCGRRGYDAPFSSMHEGGAFFLFADGQVRFLSENVDSSTYAALGTRAGNELVDDEDY
jgi:uncharacterized protein DUF1559